MLRETVRSVARRLGFEVRRFAPGSSYAAQLRAMFAAHQIDLVFDVGANVGQYGEELRRQVGYLGRIVSFEPMQAAHAALTRAAQGDALWQVAPRAAIGAEEGSITINVASNSVSSSVLPMLESHASAAPESRYRSSEVVRLATLDALTPGYLQPGSRAFLKIDTQGYEAQVLAGAPQTLARVQGVQLELSLLPLYEGQRLMPELLQYMRDARFDLWAITPAFTDPVSGRLLQVDAAFFRTAG